MHAVAVRPQALDALAPGKVHGHLREAASSGLSSGLSSRTPTVALAPAAGGVAQAGFFDDLLGGAAPGLMGAASSLLSGDTSGALGQVRETGAALAPGLVQHGASALGGMIGGDAGQTVSSLGGAAGSGLASVISGESSPGQAAGGLLSAAQPSILSLLMSLLNGR